MASIHHDDKGIHFDDGRKLIFSTFKIQVFIWLVLVTTLGGFAAWAYLAPLSSAAIAPGVIIVESKRKPIQHLEGGIVEIVHVSDGDHVQKDELLITLSHTQAQASLLRLRAQWQSDLARLNRLQSELASHQEIQFDMRLLSLMSDPNVSSLLDTQSKLFSKRQSLKSGESDVLQQKVEQSKLDLQGFQQRFLAGNRSLKYLEEQVQMHQDLLVSGNTSKSRLLDLQRERSQLQGNVADLKARIGHAKRTIAEAKLELINADYTYAKTLGEEIQDLERKLNETREAMVNAQDILTRVEIRAPQSGVVVGLNVVSENAIVPPGETLMELVPQNDELIVEALVKPEDIEALRIGLDTQVRLTAYSFRKTPPIRGKLVHISADRISDQATGSSAYLARVSLDKSELEALENISLYPGMPAEVMILLEQQTPLEYLLNPLSVSAYKAMREI
ncbi:MULTISPECIES: HlyD family type I secretion periplasmic adaptor subunit [Vibrio]|jgi:HlyD family secretion protein/epimerase transport system membrane fusion protein|uniref:HlyD family type I secretion periplasmic adaptor subunit n=1 Tax=Vibrio TaxID=662 RepID=UPI0002F5D768|nr:MULTISPECIES: HlyD family type I secretion periplasmic adaptor subunit [Vibrio]OEE86094.1 secretion protein HlyD [Vibrio crassostreae 9ZC88]PMK24395.1 secretion protein HlyD [Vibrio sp. 10N.261.54.C3]PML78332.1 secretion protein HlyD [Vibrio sp. 10N.261.51.A7]TKF43272.1 HlyD family type I secretion periplasmic adaptor subunit [Vibrio sp. F13]TKF63828.1 HlyD family type I secretion periplasmic adaptor subunit [Vibrio sp. F13]